MSNPACDKAIIEAVATDPRAEKAMKDMMASQQKFNQGFLDDMYEVAHDANLPAPGKMPDEYWEALGVADAKRTTQTARGGTPPPPTKVDKTKTQRAKQAAKGGWEALKQMRVAMMLSNPLTYLKNITATGGQAFVIRPLEESISVFLNRANPGEARSFREMYHYSAGLLRAGQDYLSMMKSVSKTLATKGAVDSNEFTKALKESGYAGDLGQGKRDIVLQETTDGPPDSNRVSLGRYLFNAAFGSQFTALQGTDVAFKMMSHRAKVQQLLSRKGMREDFQGERLDDFVATGWQQMSDRVRRGDVVDDDLADIERAGIKQSAEDTFTEAPQTGLGEVLAGNKWPVHKTWGKIGSESMQIVMPFRNIYVNLMRQSLSRRLLPFVDPKTRQEWSGALGKDAQNLARARTMGAYTLALGTWALFDQVGAKLHGPDDLDPQVRDLQQQLYGKVGNTIEMAGNYFPIDGLPPSLAVPIAMLASGRQSIDEFNYRYHGQEDVDEHFLRSFAPLITAATDGPWVKEYMNFITRANSFIQRGDIKGLGGLFAQTTVAPMKLPKWVDEAFGRETGLKNTEGFVNTIRAQIQGNVDSYGLRRNMFGRVIQPMERFGPTKDYPWHGGDTDVMNFLKAANYDRVMSSNISMKIGGQGNGRNGVAKGSDDIPMTPKMQDRFEYYVGQSKYGNGLTMADEIRQFMNSEGIYDPDTGRLIASEVQVQEGIKQIHKRRREKARTILKYNPAFNIKEKQVDKFVSGALRSNMPEQDVMQYKQDSIDEINQARLELEGYF